MLKRFLFTACFIVSFGAAAVENAREFAIAPPATEFAISPEVLYQARLIITDMVKDKTPEEILAKVPEIALALSEKYLCGVEEIVAMTEVGIPFETAYEAIIKACNIQGVELAALNRALAPGLTGTGGAGPEVSP